MKAFLKLKKRASGLNATDSDDSRGKGKKLRILDTLKYPPHDVWAMLYRSHIAEKVHTSRKIHK